MFVICKAVVKAAIRLPVLMYTTHMYIYTLTHNVVAQNRIVSLRIVLPWDVKSLSVLCILAAHS